MKVKKAARDLMMMRKMPLIKLWTWTWRLNQIRSRARQRNENTKRCRFQANLTWVASSLTLTFSSESLPNNKSCLHREARRQRRSLRREKPCLLKISQT